MVVVQKKRTMPNNKKKLKDTDYAFKTPELNLKVNMKKMGAKAADTGVKGAKTASARTRLINMAKQNKKFKDDKSFQKARDKELKRYKEVVAEGIKEGMSEKASMVGKIKKINQKTMKQKDAAFKLRSGNKPSIAKFMGVDKSPAKKLTGSGDETARDFMRETKGSKRIKEGIKDKSNEELRNIAVRNLPAFQSSRLKEGEKYREEMPDFMKTIAEMADSSRAATQILYDRGEFGKKK